MSSTGLGATPNRIVRMTSGAKITAFAQADILDAFERRLERAEDHFSVEPQRIGRRQDDAEGGQARNRDIGLEGADQRQEFTDETGRSRQPDIGEREHQEDRRRKAACASPGRHRRRFRAYACGRRPRRRKGTARPRRCRARSSGTRRRKRPAWSRAKMPMVTKPICATEEYAISFFTSSCISATSEV